MVSFAYHWLVSIEDGKRRRHPQIGAEPIFLRWNETLRFNGILDVAR